MSPVAAVVALAVVPSPITRDGARDAARRELSKAVYHRYDEPLPVRLVKAALHWLGEAFSTAAGHSPGGPAGAVALVAAAVVLVAIARWRLGPVRRTATAGRAVLGPVQRTSAEHRRLAEAAAADGRWAQAVVERMRALARGLEERDVVEPRPGRTADELAVEAGAVVGAAGAVLARAARTFDEVAYGGRAATAEAYATVVEADRAVSEHHRLGALR